MSKRYENKEEYIEDIFSSIAPKYDLLNSVLSLTRHHSWRKFAIKKCNTKPGDNVLDVCCGTGDFAIEHIKTIGSNGKSTGIDFAEPMLEIAHKKAKALAIENISFSKANACDLPFEDNTFDAVTVGFGLRNVSDVRLAVSEMARVAKPGGRVVCLEISRVRVSILASLWKLYFYILTPYIASFFRARREAYEYLPESVKEFMTREELASCFKECGLEDVKYYNLTFGAVCVHTGTKPGEFF